MSTEGGSDSQGRFLEAVGRQTGDRPATERGPADTARSRPGNPAPDRAGGRTHQCTCVDSD